MLKSIRKLKRRLFALFGEKSMNLREHRGKAWVISWDEPADSIKGTGNHSKVISRPSRRVILTNIKRIRSSKGQILSFLRNFRWEFINFGSFWKETLKKMAKVLLPSLNHWFSFSFHVILASFPDFFSRIFFCFSTFLQFPIIMFPFFLFDLFSLPSILPSSFPLVILLLFLFLSLDRTFTIWLFSN